MSAAKAPAIPQQRPAVSSRPPTGIIPFPLILLEGEEKGGKSWTALLLSASEKVGDTFILDLGEGGADEYKHIPGAKFAVLNHDGTWAQIVARIMEVKARAKWAKDNGEPPVVLIIDSATDLWNGLKGWVDQRFRRSRAGQAALAKDPDGELRPSQNLWNDANSRHRRLMTQLMTFPGIVVMTARGKEVSEVKNGKPVEGSKVWSVDAQRDVPFDATVWVRMFRTSPPMVIGARSPFVGICPGKDDPKPVAQDLTNMLEWLIFDVLRCDPATAVPRDLKHTTGGELTEDEKADDPDAREDKQATVSRIRNAATQTVGPKETERLDLITAVAEAATAAGVDKGQLVNDWADGHKGQHIREATDLDGLRHLLGTLTEKVSA